jgi:hypothetical protein
MVFKKISDEHQGESVAFSFSKGLTVEEWILFIIGLILTFSLIISFVLYLILKFPLDLHIIRHEEQEKVKHESEDSA